MDGLLGPCAYWWTQKGASGAAGGGKVPRDRPVIGRRDPWGGGAPLACGACGCLQQTHEGGPAAGEGRELGGVRYATRKGDGRRPAAEQAGQTLGHLPARVVRVEGEEDAPAAPGGMRRCALRPVCRAHCRPGGPSRRARPSRTGPRWRTTNEGAAPSRESPSTGLVPGSAWNRGEAQGSTALPAIQRASPPPAASGTTIIPAKRSPRGGQQSRAAETLGAETRGFQLGPQPRTRRVAEPETGGRAGADAPCGKVLPRLPAAPQPPSVEPHRRGEPPRDRGRTPARRPAADPRPHLTGRCIHPPPPACVSPPADRTPSTLWTKSKTSPPRPQPKQYQRSVSPYTVNDPSASRVEGTDGLADPAPPRKLDPGRLDGIAEGVLALERGDVDRRRCGHRPFPSSGRSPRTDRRETTCPGCHLIPIAPATSSMPSAVGRSTAPRPVPCL